MSSAALHVVQVSYDPALMDRESEVTRRQQQYHKLICERRPGSHMTILVSGGEGPAQHLEGLDLVPCRGGILGLVQLFFALLRLHRKQPIHVVSPQSVFDQGVACFVFCKLFRVAIVGQVHFDLFCPDLIRQAFGSGKLGRLRYRAGLWCLPHYTALRVVNSGLADEIRKRGLHWSPRSIPVALSLATEPVEREPSKTVLYVGRLEKEKGLLRWLEVARRVHQELPEARFEIVGDGSLRHRLEQEAQGLPVQFAGRVANRELSQVYARAGAFLLTSTSEGFGRAAAEAQLYELPVVAVKNRGTAEVVEHNTSGYLHEADEMEALADSVVQILQDNELAQRLGQAGRARMIDNFDPDKLRLDWVSLLLGAVPAIPEKVLPPRRCTYARWKQLSSSPFSLLRSLQYEAIRGLRFEGPILDIGGGKKTNYRHLMELDGRVDGVNIDPGIEPVYIADLNQALPIDDDTYQSAICFNTFEHIEKDEVAIDEMLRVLKPGGSFCVMIPFLYKIHASPCDFHRHTAFWWRDRLLQAGGDPSTLTVEPLVWDRLATAVSLLELPRRWEKLFWLPALLADLRYKGERTPVVGHQVLRRHNLSLGYCIVGRKAPTA